MLARRDIGSPRGSVLFGAIVGRIGVTATAAKMASGVLTDGAGARYDPGMTDGAFLRCIRPNCGWTCGVADARYDCAECGSLLDVVYDWERVPAPGRLSFFEDRWCKRNEPLDFSGVWRFRELLPFAPDARLVTIGEGQTLLQDVDPKRVDLPLGAGHLHFQYEGMNPSGSFKDNGMAAAFTAARMLGRHRVGCASTGNTSASLALYASLSRTDTGRPMQAVVFVGAGKIAYGKLSQALDYGALTLQIDGDFDACLRRIREATERLDLYLMNSVNPFRLEGQKTIMYRILEGLGWEPPDWIICPGGNLGNSSAFGKAYAELMELRLIPRVPRLAIVNAAGANTLYELVTRRGLKWNGGEWDHGVIDAHYDAMTREGRKAATVASAIEIGRPVNLPKALRALDSMNGVVCEVTDDEILDEKARIGRNGYGCEPASAASLAGLRKLVAGGVVSAGDRVVCVLTGHQLKDADVTVGYHTNLYPGEPADRAGAPRRAMANRPVRVADDLDAICDAIEKADR